MGEPWDSLFKAAGATLLIVLLALWTGKLFLPGAMKDKEDRIAQLEQEKVTLLAQYEAEKQRLLEERNAAYNESKEAGQWLKAEAIPLLTRNIDLIKTMTEQMDPVTPPRRRA